MSQINLNEYNRLIDLEFTILKLKSDIGKFKAGEYISFGKYATQILKEHNPHLKSISPEEFLSLSKYPENVDLQYFLDNSAEIKEIFQNNPKRQKSVQEMAGEIMSLRVEQRSKEISEYLVKHFLANNRTFTVRDDNTAEIWIYKDGIYVSDGKSYIQEFVRSLLMNDFKMSVCKEVVDKIMIDTYINPDEFFSFNNNIEYIPVQNGLLHIYEKKLYPFDKNMIFFNKLPITFKPQAKCPKIKNFLKDICRDKSDVETLRQFVGTCLERENKYERMLMCIGGGRNGKSKFSDLLKRFLGSYNCAGMQPSSLENPDNFNTYVLHGKLANMYMDISKTAFKNTSLLKSLSGGDPITVPRKYKSPLTFKNTASFIFGANELPMSYDISNGFWERWLLIDFPYTFSYEEVINSLEEKERWKHKIRIDDITQQITNEEELSGMLNWILDGLEKLKLDGRFTYKYTPEEVKSLWVRKSDSFAAFFMDYMEVDYDFKVPKAEIRKVYAEYCKEHKLKHMSDRHINYVMGEHGITTARHQESGQSDYYWVGAVFKKKYRITGLDNSVSFKNPTKKEKIKDYLQSNNKAKKQDVIMRFGHELVEKMLREGDLIEHKAGEVKIQ